MTSVAAEPWFSAPSLRTVLDLLNVDGGEARVAGGAVRNSLMGVPVADIDVATTLPPDVVMARAAAAGIKTVPTGIEHGTITLVVAGVPYEITTLRHDTETDGRHAKVVFGADWKADAERRDLTINALYADATGAVIDLVGGLADIETRTVRFIGKAADRVAEDYLRILRFFRFFAFYGAGRPDAEGLRACAQARDRLSTLSAERVWSELKKLLSARDPARALLWMRQAGVLTEILPESEKWGIDAIPELIAVEQAFQWDVDPLLRLAAMVPQDVERLQAMSARLRLSRAEAAYLEAFAGAPTVTVKTADTALDRLLYWNGRDGIVARLKLSLANVLRKSQNDAAFIGEVALLQGKLARAAKWEKPSFPLSGADVLKVGVAPGPKVGDLLSALEKQWVDGNFHADRATLVARLELRVAETTQE